MLVVISPPVSYSGLLNHYGKDHQDYEDCLAAKNKLIETSRNVPSVLQRSVSIYHYTVSFLVS
jgi:hypothetical protein